MAWSSVVTATQLASITTEQFFSYGGSSLVTLNPGESAHIAVDYNPVGSPTDHLNVKVYSTVDGTNFDDTPYAAMQIDKAIDPNQASIVISGVYGFRVGVSRSGTTDTITTADSKLVKDGISI